MDSRSILTVLSDSKVSVGSPGVVTGRNWGLGLDGDSRRGRSMGERDEKNPKVPDKRKEGTKTSTYSP